MIHTEKMRQKLVMVTLVLAVAMMAAPVALGQHHPLVGLLLTWQNDPTSTMTIDWQFAAVVADNMAAHTLQYRAVGSGTWHEATGQQLASVLPGRHHWRAELTGLTPDTTYEFRLAAPDRTFRFRTMPTQLSEPLRFAIGGDTRHTRIAMENMNRVAMAFDPAFIAWGGDLAYADGVRADFWVEWMAANLNTLIAPDGRVVPVITSIGNHETQQHWYTNHPEYEQTDAWRAKIAPFFYALLAFPGQPGYGVLDFGDYLSLVVLDTDHTNPVHGEQLQWLEQTLAARTHIPHVVPLYHVTAYPSVRNMAGTTETRVRELWLPLFERYGVRYAFENHDHAYKRTHPIRAGQVDPAGIVFFGDGAWGVAPRETHPVAGTWYLAQAAAVNHGMIVTLTPTEADVMAIAVDGTVIDRYTVNGVFIESPSAGAAVRADAPVSVWIDPDIDVAQVRVLQNGVELFRGVSLPERLALSGAAESDNDEQTLEVVVTDTEGGVRTQRVSFRVHRVFITDPAHNARIQGHVPVGVAVGLGEGENIRRIRVDVQPVRAFEETERMNVLDAASLPEDWTLDTLSLDDGTYDVIVSVASDRDVTSEATRRIIVRNWAVLEEPFEAPSLVFGLEFSRLKTAEKSAGWDYAVDTPGLFAGDAHRLVPRIGATEYLQWKLPDLRQFEVVVFAADAAHLAPLHVAVQDERPEADGAWRRLAADVTAEAVPDSPWQRFTLSGAVPKEWQGEHFRLTWDGAEATATVQLGSVRLTGVAHLQSN